MYNILKTCTIKNMIKKNTSTITFRIDEDLDEHLRKIAKEQVKQLYYGENLFDLDMSNLKSGIYFISLNIDGEIVVKQIVKE